MNIPKKFTFFNGDNLLKLTNIDGDYYCTLPEADANKIYSAVYDRINVEHKLHTGKWQIVADLTVEPEMKFPFTIKTPANNYYVITDEGNDSIGMQALNTGHQYLHMSKAECKKLIEQALWIVQSVGEQEAKEEIVEPVPEYKLEFGDCIHVDKQDTFNDADEAIAKLIKLADAVETVTMAFESLEIVMERMGLGGNINVQTFCCESE